MKNKVVFVFNSANDTRCMKRVEEFVEQGYNVDVYAFDRGSEVIASSDNFQVKIIGKHDISMNYAKRALIIRKSLKELFKQYKNQDVIYYFFFFDVAFVGHLSCNKPYIYELSDMPYSGIKNALIRALFESADRRIISQSFLTTLTSEGFIEYLFKDILPANYVVVPNRVDKKLLDIPYHESGFDMNHLRFSFVGGFRYKSTLDFVKYAAKNFPQHTFSVDGNIICFEEELKQLARTYSNISLNGVFKYPKDSPGIYERTDIVLSTYDADSINAQYAEPNKLYEAIYFHTPIIVSSGTYLAKKVKRLGIGWDVNSSNEAEVVKLIKGFTEKDLIQIQQKCKEIPLSEVVNENPKLFEYINSHN